MPCDDTRGDVDKDCFTLCKDFIQTKGRDWANISIVWMFAIVIIHFSISVEKKTTLQCFLFYWTLSWNNNKKVSCKLLPLTAIVLFSKHFDSMMAEHFLIPLNWNNPFEDIWYPIKHNVKSVLIDKAEHLWMVELVVGSWTWPSTRPLLIDICASIKFK